MGVKKDMNRQTYDALHEMREKKNISLIADCPAVPHRSALTSSSTPFFS